MDNTKNEQKDQNLNLFLAPNGTWWTSKEEYDLFLELQKHLEENKQRLTTVTFASEESDDSLDNLVVHK